jgi:hypothetical protein
MYSNHQSCDIIKPIYKTTTVVLGGEIKFLRFMNGQINGLKAETENNPSNLTVDYSKLRHIIKL